jgi:hypothetical protein
VKLVYKSKNKAVKGPGHEWSENGVVDSKQSLGKHKRSFVALRGRVIRVADDRLAKPVAKQQEAGDCYSSAQGLGCIRW